MDFQIEKFFWINLKINGVFYISFWIDCGDDNFVPFKNKDFFVFKNFENAIEYILENNYFNSK